MDRTLSAAQSGRRGTAMTNQSGALVWNTFPRPYGDIAEKTATDPLSGRVVVTNLRLPGQYDERLLGSLGLQGPYYNQARWYLPGVGRYQQLDPLALAGYFNGSYGPDWYNYVEGNPQRFTDASGLDRYINCNNPEWGRARKWLCRKIFGGGCKAGGTAGAVICCQADDVDCREKAGDDAKKLGECDLKLALCKATGGRNDAKPPDPMPPPPRCDDGK